jgi:RimJ/RimL family protein N-acetyltransferase
MVIDTLRTPRLLLRPLAPGDWQDVLAYTSDPDIMRYLPEGVMSAEKVQAFIAEHQPTSGAVAAILVEEERLIGHLTFHPWYASRIYEIGWVFHPGYHGQGYATEAAMALFAYGFETLGLHRIIATCQPENIPSWRVMEKLGMLRESHFRKVFAVDETTWLDEYLYAMLEEEWFARPAERSVMAGERENLSIP